MLNSAYKLLDENFLARRAAVLELEGDIGSRAGGLFMDAPGVSAEEMIEIASDRDLWRSLVEFAHSPAA